jgi:hypothetical protein
MHGRARSAQVYFNSVAAALARGWQTELLSVLERVTLSATSRMTGGDRSLSSHQLSSHRRELFEDRRLGHDHRQIPSFMGIRTARSAATSSARSYPASTCLITPMPGSLVSTRRSFCAASSVPSASET